MQKFSLFQFLILFIRFIFIRSNELPPPLCNISGSDYNCSFENGYGGDGSREDGLDPIINLLTNNETILFPDIVLLVEAARGCNSYGDYIDGTAEIANNFSKVTGNKWYYAYGVEYVNLAKSDYSKNIECSMGNSIISRFPLENIEVIRFWAQCCMFPNRVGGRMAIRSTIQIPTQNNSVHEVRIWTLHLESGTGVKDALYANIIRELQGGEVGFSDFEHFKRNEIIGGDFNAPFRDLDLSILPVEYGGYTDAHLLYKGDRCTSTDKDFLYKFGLCTYDYMFYKFWNFLRIKNPEICQDMSACAGWSDHLPIWLTLDLS